MAAGRIAKPGSRNGPCLPDPDSSVDYFGDATMCSHVDCKANRTAAASLCPVCLKPIGYETRFYRSGASGYVHATCEESIKA